MCSQMSNKMVDVAQLVNAPVCGTGDRGFESHLPPHTFNFILGCSQAVRHQTLTLACASSNLASPTKNKNSEILINQYFAELFCFTTNAIEPEFMLKVINEAVGGMILTSNQEIICSYFICIPLFVFIILPFFYYYVSIFYIEKQK